MKRSPGSDARPSRTGPILEEEVYIEMLRAAQVMARWVIEGFKANGLSQSQYNVLRILRGARPEPLSAKVIAERMIHDDPDLTRLLDKLEAAGLVAKERSTRDRRVVEVRITQAGLDLLETATGPMRQRLQAGLATVGERHMQELVERLRQVRAAADAITNADTNADPSPGDPARKRPATKRRRKS